MKTNELRLGNYVSDDIFTYCVSEICINTIYGIITDVHNHKAVLDDFELIYKEGVFHLNIENIAPILLTEEWLLEFEFYKYYGRFYEREGWIHFNNKLEIIKPYVNEMYYVHQLQNLYFALTNKELNPTLIPQKL